jgi:SAM-dependent methyltransferase
MMNDFSSLDVDSLERIVPDELEDTGATGRATLDLHLARYAFAAQMLRAGRALDMACGVGYGTRFLVEQNPRIERAHGVDLSASAIEYARECYADPRIEYFCGDAARFRGSEPYDSIVSLETIEHVPNPAHFFRHLVSLLRPGGRLIASVPTTPSTDGNPNHLTDFTERAFRRLGSANGLRELGCLRQIQPFNPAAITLGAEKRLARSRAQLIGFYARWPNKLALRLWATVRYGFQNRYITVAWEKPDYNHQARDRFCGAAP